MAIHASEATLSQGTIIGLTGINDDEEDEGEEEESFIPAGVGLQPQSSEPGLGSPDFYNKHQHQHQHQYQLKPMSSSQPAVSTPNSIFDSTSNGQVSRHSETSLPSTQAARPYYVSPSQSSPVPRPPIQDRPHSQDRPHKRRKLQNGAGPRTAFASPVTDTKALTKCLQNQVFPHLEREVKWLNTSIYDVGRLGGRIIGKIADSDFERSFRNNNGRLPPDVEAGVVVRIKELVAELTKGNEFRWERRPLTPKPAPPKSTSPKSVPKAIVPRPTSQTPVSILPSVEDLPDDLPLNENVQDDPDEVDPIDLDEAETQTPHHQPPKPVVTPQRLRTRAKAAQWQSGRAYDFKKEGSPLQVRNRWFGLSSRPYLSAKARQEVAKGVENGRLLHLRPDELSRPSVYHVDFSEEEVKYLRDLGRSLYGRPSVKAGRSVYRDLRHLIKKAGGSIRTRILDAHREGYTHAQPPPSSLLKRSTEDVDNFLDDLLRKQHEWKRKLLYLERDESATQGDVARVNNMPSLLLAREIAGNRLGSTRRYQNFTTTFRSIQEDRLEPKVEWTNCAGDIMTFTWSRDTLRGTPTYSQFFCGTTTHSDSHNQQYNKPGNLLVGSTTKHTLKAVADHRIPRPLITHGDNALESMRESQDPWLYTSVVSADYDPEVDYVFTSSFDNTVKVWGGLEHEIPCQTWRHDGRVNFVVTNKVKPLSKVATAADVPTKAVRVYYRDAGTSDTLESVIYKYDEFSCKRVHGEDYVPSDKWAYFPSAVRWGIDPSVNHCLLVGYSPRSLSGDEYDIPADKQNTGELCLWDTNTNTEIKVNSVATANVFEVAWHPHRPSFAVATSASQTSEKIEKHVRTQIRIFELNDAGQYGVIKTLDCPAIDINELLIRPNSLVYSYVAAGCTDGKVYIWDSSGSEDPMCVLEHGEPVEEIIGDREHEDVGVKFMAWATTTDRLYTGSSDGIVKVWNIRQGKGALVRDLIEVAAPITAGAFSPDFTKLLIGDGSGRVYLMDVDADQKDDQAKPAAVSSGFLQLPQPDGKPRAIRRPRPIIPHAEPPPPVPCHAENDNEHTPNPEPDLPNGQARARQYLRTSQLRLHPDPTIGAVQGPAYAAARLVRAEAHLDGDGGAPLLGGFESRQRANQAFPRTTRFRRQGSVEDARPKGLADLHARNESVSLDWARLDGETREALRAERAEVEVCAVDLDYDSDGVDESDGGSGDHEG